MVILSGWAVGRRVRHGVSSPARNQLPRGARTVGARLDSVCPDYLSSLLGALRLRLVSPAETFVIWTMKSHRGSVRLWSAVPPELSLRRPRIGVVLAVLL